MKIPNRCDVVVIGGGPAGSMAAILLGQKGYDVVLFDKCRHPRYNVGESLIPHFWKYCELAKVADRIESEGFIKKAGGTVVWDGVIRQMAFKDFGYTRPALHVERDRFDHILLEHAKNQGAKAFEDVSVLQTDLHDDKKVNVIYRTSGEKAPGEISCRFVVDASGQGAVMAKQLGARIVDEGFRFMSIWGYFEGSKYVASDGRAYPFENLRTIPPTTFVSSIGEWGWLWHIPLRESTSVGLILPLEAFKTGKVTDEALETYFVRKCFETPILNRLLETARYCEGSLHMIRDYSYLPTQLAGPGFFLIGDAAAFIDPIFSIGVVLAMYSATIAAWAIDRSFKSPRTAVENQALFSHQFRSRLEVARLLALPCYNANGGIPEFAKESIQFERSIEQELMYVVSTVTTRSPNYLELAKTKGGNIVTSDKFRVLEEIVF